jgi:inner membrane protein
MMAKAHIAVGMAAAFTAMRPESIPEALPVVTGAALGCLICDLDCDNPRERTESSRYRVAMAVVAAAALIEDHLIGAGMWASVGNHGPYIWFAGFAAFVLVCAFASISRHRGFAHSFLALAAETAALWLVFPMTAKPFAIAFISHQLLDLLNRKPVRLFYPAKTGFSLDLFYADRLANKVLAAAGTAWLVFMILTGASVR